MDSKLAAARKKLVDKKAKLKEDIARIDLELKFIQTKCSHTNQYKTTDYTGGVDYYCPDCEKCL